MRSGQKSDIDQIAHFQCFMALETENFQLDFETVKKGVGHIIDHPDKGEYLVILDGIKLVASLLLLPEWSDWRNKTILWIHSVYVDKEYRGQGLYKLMYQEVLKKIHSRDDLAGVRLYVDKTNKVAQAVYSKLGMNGDHYQVFEQMK